MLGNFNPVLIQQGDLNGIEDSTPLVLIHDGGGTVFPYYGLGNLGRTVYGLWNPRFVSGRRWTGGIVQMCKVYAKLIQSVIPKGKIFLGGWSLGGILSLEITKQLEETDITVAGIVMIDSICPNAFKSESARSFIHTPVFNESTRPEMQLMVSRCIRQSGELLRSWEIPKFSPRRDFSKQYYKNLVITEVELLESSESSGHSSPGNRHSFTSKSSSDTDYSEDVDSETIKPGKSLNLNIVNEGLKPQPPPIVLLRCKNYVPIPNSNDPNAMYRVDVARSTDYLGWREYDPKMISRVSNLDCHHFNVFAAQNVSQTTEETKAACSWLERKDN